MLSLAHPFGASWPDGVKVYGNVTIGEGVSIGAPSEINGTGSCVEIGEGCDIASFVEINVADSSDRCVGLSKEIDRAPVILGAHVFVGSHAFIGGGWTIGHHTKIAAGTMLVRQGRLFLAVPEYSLVYGNPAQIRPRYYARETKELTCQD